MATFTNTNKSADPTWINELRRGRDLRISDIADLTFNDVLFDGTLVKDATFEQLQDTSWANVNKSSDPTWTNKTKN